MKRAVQVSYFLLRVVAGFLFIQTGGLILFGWFGGMPGGEKVRLMSQTGIGGVLEFFGGILIMLGLFTRPVAFILSGMMGSPIGSFTSRMAAGRFRMRGCPPCCSVSSSSTWPREAAAIGASMP